MYISIYFYNIYIYILQYYSLHPSFHGLWTITIGGEVKRVDRRKNNRRTDKYNKYNKYNKSNTTIFFWFFGFFGCPKKDILG